MLGIFARIDAAKAPADERGGIAGAVDDPLYAGVDALDDVVRSGRVRYLGASSMDAWRFMKALSIQRSLTAASPIPV